MSAVHRQAIRDLTSGMQNAFVIGLIIDASNMKSFDTTRMRFNNGLRGVWTFTLRDSEEDTINVTVWGSVEYIRNLSTKFHIGSTVEVINPKVVNRNPEDRNQIFVPSVSSPYSLTVNEDKSLVQAHDAPTRQQFECLLSRPIKNVENLQELKQILEQLEQLRDQYIDVLLVVTFVSDVRNIFTRDGRKVSCRTFEATDGSTDQVLSLILWSHDWIERAAFWEPKQTVLLLTDARIAYDNFKKKTVLTISRKTLITENPDTPETTRIRDAIQQYDSNTISCTPFVVPKPDTIIRLMTIEQISKKLNKKAIDSERIQFATILRAYVVEFNVDSASPDIISTRCAQCKRVVPDGRDSCMNLECPSGNGILVPLIEVILNLKMNLKDDTGYLVGCKLTGTVAERAIGCTVDEFQAMTFSERSNLKWKYMMERCELRLHIVGPTTSFPGTTYTILSISRMDNEDETDLVK